MAEHIQVEAENGATYTLHSPKVDGKALSRSTVVDAVKISVEEVVNSINMMQKVQARLVDSKTIVVE